MTTVIVLLAIVVAYLVLRMKKVGPNERGITVRFPPSKGYKVLQPGWHFVFTGKLDKVSLEDQTIDVPTFEIHDGSASGMVTYKVVDALSTVTNVANLKEALMKLTQTIAQNCAAGAELNEELLPRLSNAVEKWGIEIVAVDLKRD